MDTSSPLQHAKAKSTCSFSGQCFLWCWSRCNRRYALMYLVHWWRAGIALIIGWVTDATSAALELSELHKEACAI